MPHEPPSRSETARERLIGVLTEGFCTTKTLSGRTGLSEKQVREHLEHIERSLARRGSELERDPPRCLKCDFSFEGRERYRAPSRCPECRSERVSAPLFRIV